MWFRPTSLHLRSRRPFVFVDFHQWAYDLQRDPDALFHLTTINS
jgi:hypothetical protein